MPLTFLIGGARSGKSTLAVRQATATATPVVFVATAEARDGEMAARIARHRAERPPDWRTVEAPLELAAALRGAPPDATVIVDCLSLWVSNLLEQCLDDDEVWRRAREAAAVAASRDGLTIAVSNEVGMGIVPMHELSRRYRDLLGWVNAAWADAAAEAVLVVAGRRLPLERGLAGGGPLLASGDFSALRDTRKAGNPPVVGVGVAPVGVVADTVAAIRPADGEARLAAQAAFDGKAKPPGSLGRLEELACRIASVRGTATPGPLRPAVVVCAADHGVADEGVSAYPQAVTASMVTTFASGGAAVSVLARQAGARLVVADLGVRTPTTHPSVLDRRIGAGTANAALGPAMSRAQAEQAVATGISIVDGLISDGVNALAIGEMGIANTTSASALVAALLGTDPAVVCGRGTGIDDACLAHKVDVIRRMLAVNQVPVDDPVGALAAVGGFEIAALTGLVLGAAAHRVPVVLDGFITGAAALVAARTAPASVDAMIASHRSAEPGHTIVLQALGLQPLLTLDMRLGEASGAALALPVVAASVALLRHMATLESVVAAPVSSGGGPLHAAAVGGPDLPAGP
ncbi:MAG: nicotinate-nucleotide--dimethylbenzimidazole phosphoribosyltransferase [Jiangellaceae bacterium]